MRPFTVEVREQVVYPLSPEAILARCLLRWWVTLGDFEGDHGIILELHLTNRGFDWSEVLRYRPPADRRVDGKGFTGGTFHGGDFFVTSFNAVHRVSARGELREVYAREDFNDLHSIAVSHSRLWVTNTGCDRVDVLSLDGELLDAHMLSPRESDCGPAHDPTDPYFHRGADLPFHRRRVVDRVHPNHVAFHSNAPIVTRFADCSLANLESGHIVVQRTPGPPHDGVVVGDTFFITCTTGVVVAYDAIGAEWKEHERIVIGGDSGVSGWCRGLSVHGDMLLVGFTRIARVPRHRWSERPFEGTRTGIVRLDRASGKVIDFVDFARLGGHPKVFSIVSVPEPVASLA